MKCKWYADFEGTCTNGECPYCGDTCRTNEHPEVCRFAEEKVDARKLNADELIQTLRICASNNCDGCPFQACDLYLWGDREFECLPLVQEQAADMLEALTKGEKQ